MTNIYVLFRKLKARPLSKQPLATMHRRACSSASCTAELPFQRHALHPTSLVSATPLIKTRQRRMKNYSSNPGSFKILQAHIPLSENVITVAEKKTCDSN